MFYYLSILILISIVFTIILLSYLTFKNSNPTIISMTIIPENPEKKIGEKWQFYAVVKYSEGISLKMTGSIKWSTSDNSILTISESGICTALKAGYAEVYAMYFKITVKAHVRVSDNR